MPHLAEVLPEEAGSPVTNVFTSGEGGWNCYKIPYLFQAASGSVLSFVEARGGDCMDWQPTDIVLRRSFDNGSTWTADIELVVPGASGRHNVAGNMGIVQDSSSGRIFMPFTRGNFQFYLTYSDDDGETWSKPTEMTGIKKWNESWIGFGPPSGLQTKSGRIVVPCYGTQSPIYENGIFTYSFMIFSDDHGATWQRSHDIPQRFPFITGRFGNETQVVEFFDDAQGPSYSSSSTLLINSRAAWGPRIQSYSYDDGLTWTPYEKTTLPVPVLGCEGSTVALPDGQSALFSGPDSSTIFRVDLTVWSSNNKGKSWEKAYVVDATSGAVGYSSMVVLQDGRVAILWEKSVEKAAIFVPDNVSMRFLPTALQSASAPTPPGSIGSGEHYDMVSWQSATPSEVFYNSHLFRATLFANYLFLLAFFVVAISLGVSLCSVSPSPRRPPLRVAFLVFSNLILVLLVSLGIVGVASQQYFSRDDGDRWLVQSRNVIAYDSCCALLAGVLAGVLRRQIKTGHSKLEDGKRDGGRKLEGSRAIVVEFAVGDTRL